MSTGTLIHKLRRPVVCESQYGYEACLDDEIQDLPNTVFEIWYWYSAEYYEGSGNAILRYTDGTWGAVDLGHCSCYGPFDEKNYLGKFKTLIELEASLTGGAKDDFGELLLAIKTTVLHGHFMVVK
jgi:hypothetical protein